MIAKIKGKIEEIKEKYLIVDVNGIGYQIFVTDNLRNSLTVGEEITLSIFTYVKEDTFSLYGFFDKAEKRIFELLIGISGIGPKAAMGILSVTDPVSIKTAILSNKLDILTKVSGIGKKTAERIILELQNKIDSLAEIESVSVSPTDTEALDALLAMGYTLPEAREALKNVPKDIVDVGEIVKFALKNK